ncbi:MAG: aminotransferase class I/II-fold pyridoxal phosphate-dependent enzyme [Planctomycetota bacterium]|nr:MAG: aminotransferase class I/II-fold pyridoxal phosphate-dependent enzyme [Planctomycetota bacterium]REJ96968.1 MAG: aminotransferase class I/II-fold pyridoxal phosphate-dependent enzyme [Planctomycetota bacterium]REK24222.1 MAG: aminotransferase class I/II-fold pyridoxal phosphate-dependent enzyme [Planctomycetota bacterium]REK28792.1 MAG: aminotransferase class I/II-fold pyridoxal phosphate-dependent enzyme [Planctomycetota bacterium]
MTAQLSSFARSLSVETAFTVLAVAKSLKAKGKDVVELEIGDSPFESTESARAAGIEAIEGGQTHYCPSPGIPEFREAAAEFVREEFKIPAQAENIVAGPGAKIFEQFFCEAFLDPGDSVLVFSPFFPTYTPNIERRGAKAVFSPLRQANEFRPEISEIERFLAEAESPKAIFLNSPHNPTGGVTTEEDLAAIADAVRGRNIAVFSDEPYCHMVWKGRHHSILEQPGMMEQCVAAYTFSKSYSMSGWRLGFAVSSSETADAIGKMINTSLSCTPPLVQLAGTRALKQDHAERNEQMQKFREKVTLLADGLNRIDGFHTLDPAATFYVFPNVAPVCNRLGITSHGLAVFLLEAADDNFGVACLGGECFGEAGHGFLRFSCAEPNDRLQSALDFLPLALSRTERIDAFLDSHPQFRLKTPYRIES